MLTFAIDLETNKLIKIFYKENDFNSIRFRQDFQNHKFLGNIVMFTEDYGKSEEYYRNRILKRNEKMSKELTKEELKTLKSYIRHLEQVAGECIQFGDLEGIFDEEETEEFYKEEIEVSKIFDKIFDEE